MIPTAPVLALSLVLLAPAAASDVARGPDATAPSGRPHVEVRPAADGNSGVVHATIDIAAPQATVWAVMTDCELAPRLVPNLKSCRIVERDPQGRWDVREQVSKRAFLPPVRTVYREEFEPPDLVTFHRVGGDLEVLEGEWRLTRRGDVTRVIYEARAAAPFRVPGWVARVALRSDLASAFAALRREAEARAANER